MSVRSLIGRCLFALLLLAGAPALAAVPGFSDAPKREIGLPGHNESRIQAPSRHDHGRLGEVALDAAWADSDDDPKPLAFAPETAAPAPAGALPVVIGLPATRPPLSHWPCASTPTGPPRS